MNIRGSDSKSAQAKPKACVKHSTLMTTERTTTTTTKNPLIDQSSWSYYGALRFSFMRLETFSHLFLGFTWFCVYNKLIIIELHSTTSLDFSNQQLHNEKRMCFKWAKQRASGNVSQDWPTTTLNRCRPKQTVQVDLKRLLRQMHRLAIDCAG